MWRPPRVVCALAGAVVLFVVPAPAVAQDAEPSGGEDLRLIANSPLVEPDPRASVRGSDVAFWGDRAYAGNYGGFPIFDISRPASPPRAR